MSDETSRERKIISKATHDLRSPLRKARMLLEMIREDVARGVDAESLDHFDTASRALVDLDGLLGDVRDFVECLQSAWDTRPVDPGDIVTSVIQGLRAEIEQRGAEVRVEGESVPVSADEDGLAVVLRHLLMNALLYCKKGTAPEVTVAMRRDGDRLHISVADKGTGIDEKYLPTIFEPFVRLVSKSHIPGAGLGLAASHQIVEGMGGHLEAASKPTEGTNLTVSLPLAG